MGGGTSGANPIINGVEYALDSLGGGGAPVLEAS